MNIILSRRKKETREDKNTKCEQSTHEEAKLNEKTKVPIPLNVSNRKTLEIRGCLYPKM